MEVTDITIPAKDGYPLAASLYRPQRDEMRDATVVVSSATAVKRGFYDKFARFLCQHGFTVLTYDYRGIGGSLRGDIKAFDGRMHQWGENDLAGILEGARKCSPASKKLLLVGHSAGGQLLGLCANSGLVSAMLAIAAQN